MELYDRPAAVKPLEHQPVKLATYRPNRFYANRGNARWKHKPDTYAPGLPAPERSEAEPVRTPQPRRMKLSHRALAGNPYRLYDFGGRPVHIWITNWLAYFRPDGKGHTELMEEAGAWPPKVAFKMIQERDPKLKQGYVLVVAK